MYLFSLEKSLSSEQASSHNSQHPRLNSTASPIGWLTGKLAERRQRKTISIFGEMQVTQWQPVVCGEMVVYVRRSIDN